MAYEVIIDNCSGEKWVEQYKEYDSYHYSTQREAVSAFLHICNDMLREIHLTTNVIGTKDMEALIHRQKKVIEVARDFQNDDSKKRRADFRACKVIIGRFGNEG